MSSPPAYTSTDRPVFVADHRWRQRFVGAAIALVGALLLGWVAAVITGALGFGNLPALSFTGEVKEPAAAIGSKPDSPGQGAAGGVATRDSLTISRPKGQMGSDPRSAPGAGRHTSAANPSSRNVKSGSGHGNASLTAAGGVSTKKGAPRSSPGNGTSAAAPTGSGNAGSTSTRAPTATPSGNEIPSGGASGPSGNANSAAEGGAGKGHGSTLLIAG
jgi:hypothetical protein